MQKKLKVICPASTQYREEVIYMVFVERDGKPFPLPCNGCENRSGGTVCDRCCSDITAMLWKDPYMDLSQPVRPSPSAPEEP